MNNEGYPLYGEDDPQTAINTRDIAALNQEVATLQSGLNSFQSEINTVTQDISIIQGRLDHMDDELFAVHTHVTDLGKDVTAVTNGLQMRILK